MTMFRKTVITSTKMVRFKQTRGVSDSSNSVLSFDVLILFISYREKEIFQFKGSLVFFASLLITLTRGNFQKKL